MYKIITLLLFFILSTKALAGSDSLQQSNSFQNIFSTTCMKYLNDLNQLRSKLAPLPKLPPEKASFFLNGHSGFALPVPDRYGTFVLAIPDNKNTCFLYTRHADTSALKTKFINLVSTAPTPLTSNKNENYTTQTTSNGITETVSYSWSYQKYPRKFLFMLTTAPQSSDLQVMASASIVNN